MNRFFRRRRRRSPARHVRRGRHARVAWHAPQNERLYR